MHDVVMRKADAIDQAIDGKAKVKEVADLLKSLSGGNVQLAIAEALLEEKYEPVEVSPEPTQPETYVLSVGSIEPPAELRPALRFAVALNEMKANERRNTGRLIGAMILVP